ncbi:MAG: DUF5666 domain-containing protein, partial [bacterium]
TDVSLTPSTEIKGLDGEAITPLDLAVGNFLRVKASRSDGSLDALVVRITGGLISDVDSATSSIIVADTTVLVSETTEIELPGGGEGRFSDLEIGKVVLLRGDFVSTDTLAATRIRVLAEPHALGDIQGFTNARHRRHDGHPVLGSDNNINTFGSLQLPAEPMRIQPGQLYLVQARISTSVENAAQVPEVRVRVNSQTRERAAFLSIDSTGDGALSPTPEGRDYLLVYEPPLSGVDASDGLDSFMVSLDLVNFGPNDAPQGEVELQHVNVSPLAKQSVNVVRTIQQFGFSEGSEGWLFSSVEPIFSAPRARFMPGSLRLGASNDTTFGMWSASVDNVLEPGKIYRARFTVSSDITDPVRVPALRLRLANDRFQLASVVLIDSQLLAASSPTALGRTYDVYYVAPAGITPGEGLVAAFEIVNFDNIDDLNGEIRLERVAIEEVAF